MNGILTVLPSYSDFISIQCVVWNNTKLGNLIEHHFVLFQTICSIVYIYSDHLRFSKYAAILCFRSWKPPYSVILILNFNMTRLLLHTYMKKQYIGNSVSSLILCCIMVEHWCHSVFHKTSSRWHHINAHRNKVLNIHCLNDLHWNGNKLSKAIVLLVN